MSEKISNVLRENNMLKSEMERLVTLIKENEAKHKGFQLVEDAFLLSETIEEMDNKALSYLEDIFGFDRVALYVDAALINVDPASLELCKRVIPTDERTLRYAYVEKRPYFGTYLEGLISDFRAIENIGSYLIAPIIESGKIIASLNLYSCDPEKLTGEGHSDFVQELTFKVSVALRNQNNSGSSTRQSQRDYLTGLYNRGTIYPLVQESMGRVKADGTPFSLIIADLDEFRSVNTKVGPDVGDTVLKKIAYKIAALLDPSDAFGRFGGDEFFIISERATDIAINSLFKNISDVVKEVSAELFDGRGSIGISAGYILVPQHLDMSYKNIADIINAADEAQHYSKVMGKGVCTSAVTAGRNKAAADLQEAISKGSDGESIVFKSVKNDDELPDE